MCQGAPAPVFIARLPLYPVKAMAKPEQDQLFRDELVTDRLSSARRPKPPSLKEEALQALERFSGHAHAYADGLKEEALQALERFSGHAHAHAYADEMMADFDLLSRALEQLDD